MKLIFICKYNAFRSRVAESYFNKINKNKNIKVISRGFIVGISAGRTQLEILEKYGIKIKGKSKPVNFKELTEADRIIIVADDIPEIMFDYQNFDFKKKLTFWKIPDEQKGRGKNIIKIINSIKDKVEKLVEELK